MENPKTDLKNSGCGKFVVTYSRQQLCLVTLNWAGQFNHNGGWFEGNCKEHYRELPGKFHTIIYWRFEKENVPGHFLHNADDLRIEDNEVILPARSKVDGVCPAAKQCNIAFPCL